MVSFEMALGRVDFKAELKLKSRYLPFKFKVSPGNMEILPVY